MSLVDCFSRRSSAFVVALVACFGLSACGTIAENVVKHSLRSGAVGAVKDVSGAIKREARPVYCTGKDGERFFAAGQCPEDGPAQGAYSDSLIRVTPRRYNRFEAPPRPTGF